MSVDGSCAKVHDSCRGPGSFDGAIRGIRTLRRHRINVAVRVTIHRYNIDDLGNIARFLLEELGLPGFGTNSAGYLGTCRVNADDLLLNIEERKEAMATLLRLAEKYPDRISASAGPLAEGRVWRRMENSRAQGAPAFPSNRHTIPLTGFEFCAGCPYITYCTGNCPGLAYTFRLNGNEP